MRNNRRSSNTTTTAFLYEIISNNPGLSRSDIAKIARLDGDLVSAHLANMNEFGKVTRKGTRGNFRWYARRRPASSFYERRAA